MSCLCKQCRSRSVGFWRSQLIWICTVCHKVFEFISTIWIKYSDWLKIRNGRGILVYSAGQGLSWYFFFFLSLFSAIGKRTSETFSVLLLCIFYDTKADLFLTFLSKCHKFYTIFSINISLKFPQTHGTLKVVFIIILTLILLHFLMLWVFGRVPLPEHWFFPWFYSVWHVVYR